MTEETLNFFYDHGELGFKCSYDHCKLLNRDSAAYYLNVRKNPPASKSISVIT